MWSHIESCEFTKQIKDGNDQIIKDHIMNIYLKGFSFMTSITIIEEHGGKLSKPRFRFRGNDVKQTLLLSQDIPQISNNPQTFMLPFWTRDSLVEINGPLHFEIIVSSRGTSIVKCFMSLLLSPSSHMVNIPPQIDGEMPRQYIGVMGKKEGDKSEKKRRIPRLRGRTRTAENSVPLSVTKVPYFQKTDDDVATVATVCSVYSGQSNIIPVFKNPNRRSVSDLSPGQSTTVFNN